MVVVPYPTLTQAIAQLRKVVYFKEHLAQQLGMENHYFPGAPSRLVSKLVHFLKVVNLHQQTFPLEPVPVDEWVDVKHLPSKVYDQTTQLIQGWFPLADELEENQSGLRLATFYQDWWEEDWHCLDPVTQVTLGLLNHAEWNTILETFGVSPSAFSMKELPLEPDLIDDQKLKVLCQQQEDNTRYLYDAVAVIDNLEGNYFLSHYDVVEPVALDDFDALQMLRQEFQEALTLCTHRNQLNEWLTDNDSPETSMHKLKTLVRLWNQARKEGVEEEEEEEQWVQLCLF